MCLVWVAGIELVGDMSDAIGWEDKSLGKDTYGESEMGALVEANESEWEDTYLVDTSMEGMLWEILV